MRRAFTLIELLVAITILSIVMLFLYKSYANTNKLNTLYKSENVKLENFSRIKRQLYRDLLVAKRETIVHIQEDPAYDFISFRAQSSLHNNAAPFICYIVRNKELYRVESAKQIKDPNNIERDLSLEIDRVMPVKRFKLFGLRKNTKEAYLLDFIPANMKNTEILLRISILN